MDVKTAREFMLNELQSDEDFRQGYRANIAMLIYDDQILSHKAPTNLSTVEGCNSIAERLINLIFG